MQKTKTEERTKETETEGEAPKCKGKRKKKKKEKKQTPKLRSQIQVQKRKKDTAASCFPLPASLAMAGRQLHLGALETLGAFAEALAVLEQDDVRRVYKVERDDGGGDERGVEDVQPDLVAQQVAVAALDVLDDPEDATDHDEAAAGVEHGQHGHPAVSAVALERACDRRRLAVDAEVEHAQHGQETAEEQDLHEQAAEDQLLAEVARISALRQHRATQGLHQEREHVAGDEELCQPFDPDHRVVRRLQVGHQPAQHHVDRRRQQRRRHEQQDRLDDVWRQLLLVFVRLCPR